LKFEVLVEIYIYANRIVDMMYEKCNCQLKCSLEEFFKSNTNAILQIGNCHLAVWRQRGMFYCFDSYPRGTEGFLCCFLFIQFSISSGEIWICSV